MEKEKRQEMLLAVIALLARPSKNGRVWQPALVDCLTEIQKEIALGYKFAEKIPYYSYELSEDLNDLWIHKYILRYKHRSDLLPKNFIALWPIGRIRAEKIIKDLEPKTAEVLNRAVGAVLERT